MSSWVYTVTVLFVSQVLDGLPVPVQRAATAARGFQCHLQTGRHDTTRGGWWYNKCSQMLKTVNTKSLNLFILTKNLVVWLTLKDTVELFYVSNTSLFVFLQVLYLSLLMSGCCFSSSPSKSVQATKPRPLQPCPAAPMDPVQMTLTARAIVLPTYQMVRPTGAFISARRTSSCVWCGSSGRTRPWRPSRSAGYRWISVHAPRWSAICFVWLRSGKGENIENNSGLFRKQYASIQCQTYCF